VKGGENNEGPTAKRGKLTAPQMTMPARIDAGHRIRSCGPKFTSITPLPDPIDQRRTGEKKNQQQQQLREEAPKRQHLRLLEPRVPALARNAAPRFNLLSPAKLGNWQRLGQKEAVNLRGLVPDSG